MLRRTCCVARGSRPRRPPPTEAPGDPSPGLIDRQRACGVSLAAPTPVRCTGCAGDANGPVVGWHTTRCRPPTDSQAITSHTRARPRRTACGHLRQHRWRATSMSHVVRRPPQTASIPSGRGSSVAEANTLFNPSQLNRVHADHLRPSRSLSTSTAPCAASRESTLGRARLGAATPSCRYVIFLLKREVLPRSPAQARPGGRFRLAC